MNSKMPHRYINLHTHRPTGIDNLTEIVNIELSNTLPNALPEYCSLGIHPWHASDNNIALDRLNKHAKNKQFIAIGETGLDKVRCGTYEQQLDLLHKHIELSEELHKPLILHCVRYYNEIITLRKELKPKQAWIFHGFNASVEIMKQATNHGFYFSYGPSILNSKSKAAKSLLHTPSDRLFFETDDSTESIENIYTKAAHILGIQINDLLSITNDNFKFLFNSI
ncbi:TatD family hydrolase [Carboxylicivirga sp. N1Y90]|uniref:TatD family hydrolase n=1 Tax=Carboxylicivirga fragile TaxID=3417571 RepID=UPI003D34E0C2|nr:TatD family hydrolase [Marinilabiliaceae bacterium N1Y90]